jgi:hypothetical protein
MQDKNYNFWQKSLDDSDFVKFAKHSYQLHKQSNRPDYTCHGRPFDIDLNFLDQLEFDQGIFFKKSPTAPVTEFLKLGNDFDDAFNYVELDTAALSDDHELTKRIKAHFDLKTISVRVNKQRPNHMIGLHKDANKSLIIKHQKDFLISKLRKYVVFVSPWTEGQVFMLGKSAHTNWQTGDVISFDWFMPHATANASGSDRVLLVVTGVEN